MTIPSVMVAGPKTKVFQEIARALDTNARDGTFSLIAWDTGAAGTRPELGRYREKARHADAVVFVFGLNALTRGL